MSDIRSQFPALERTHNGMPVAYFDAPGGTQVPRRVADAMTDYLLHHNANTHWAYPTSEETDAIITGARAAAGEFLRCAADEIVFGANMTTLTFHLARALGRTWKRGDEVIVTDLDHQPLTRGGGGSDQRHAAGDRLRREHDHADLPPRSRAWADMAGGR